jgi:hypothetical protein
MVYYRYPLRNLNKIARRRKWTTTDIGFPGPKLPSIQQPGLDRMFHIL